MGKRMGGDGQFIVLRIWNRDLGKIIGIAAYQFVFSVGRGDLYTVGCSIYRKGNGLLRQGFEGFQEYLGGAPPPIRLSLPLPRSLVVMEIPGPKPRSSVGLSK